MQARSYNIVIVSCMVNRVNEKNWEILPTATYIYIYIYINIYIYIHVYCICTIIYKVTLPFSFFFYIITYILLYYRKVAV